MSAQKEQELLMQEIEEEERREKPSQMCVVSKSGITLMGFHVSWMVVILVAVLAFFWLHQSGMLPESIKDILGSDSSSGSSSSSTSTTSTGTSNVMTGGFKSAPFSRNPGQVRQMMGH